MRHTAILVLLLAACSAPHRLVDARIEETSLVVWAETKAENDHVIDIGVYHDGELVGGGIGTGCDAFEWSQGVNSYADDAAFDIVVEFISEPGVVTKECRVTVAKTPASD